MKFLDSNHIITGDEYFRQINFFECDSDNYAKCTFITKWMSIRYLLGPIWKNKPLKKLNDKYYEYVLFDNEDEKKLTTIFTDKTIKVFDEMKWHVFRLWDDWIPVLWKSISENEKQEIINFEFNKCPSCKQRYLSKKNVCSCGFGWNHFSDDYREWQAQCREIKAIQDWVKTNV